MQVWQAEEDGDTQVWVNPSLSLFPLFQCSPVYAETEDRQ